jgi:hypothetical protein
MDVDNESGMNVLTRSIEPIGDLGLTRSIEPIGDLGLTRSIEPSRDLRSTDGAFLLKSNDGRRKLDENEQYIVKQYLDKHQDIYQTDFDNKKKNRKLTKYRHNDVSKDSINNSSSSINDERFSSIENGLTSSIENGLTSSIENGLTSSIENGLTSSIENGLSSSSSLDVNGFSPALQAVAIVGEAVSEGPHQLQVFEIWVTLYVYYRRQFPQLSSIGILSLVTQKWETDKQSIIQNYLDNSFFQKIQNEPNMNLFQIEDSSSSTSKSNEQSSNK